MAAFMDMPGVSHALGFPEECNSVDVLTGATILSNVKTYFEGSLSTTGPRFTEQRRVAQGVASSIYGDSLNMRSVTRLTGISSKLLKSGGKLRLMNYSSNAPTLKSSLPLSRSHSYPLEKVHDWFHTPNCSKVSLDKSLKVVYKRRNFTLPNDHELKLNCERRTRFAPKRELAESYMVSEQHRAIMEEDPMLSINVKTVQQCICPCIKECKVRECICPVCTGHRYLLEGWEEMRKEARKSETCDCLQCVDGSPWRNASSSPSAYRRASTCGKVPYPDIDNPCDGVTPEFNQLRCSLLDARLELQQVSTGIPHMQVDLVPAVDGILLRHRIVVSRCEMILIARGKSYNETWVPMGKLCIAM